MQGKRRCNAVRCGMCGSTFMATIECLAEKCDNRSSCLQMGISKIDVSHLYEWEE